VVNPGRADERVLAPMSDGNVLRRGDVVRLSTSGGGGWGDPLDRPPERVARDVAGGFVSVESARDDYGVVFDAGGGVDPVATTELRVSKRTPLRMFHREVYFGPLLDSAPSPGGGLP
jgi:N-methylhydantoinase B